MTNHASSELPQVDNSRCRFSEMKVNPLSNKTKKEMRCLLENWKGILTTAAVQECQKSTV